jgi:heme/copper-type cytochrome/quinol oxidase subunit 1
LYLSGAASLQGVYPPLSIRHPGLDMTILAIHILGASSIMGSINIITTRCSMCAWDDSSENANVFFFFAGRG